MRKPKLSKCEAIAVLVVKNRHRDAKRIADFKSKVGTDQGWDGYAKKLGLASRLWP